MKYYLDEDLPYRVAEVARRVGIDVVSSREVGNNGAHDDVQLAYAAAQGRVMVTRNAADYIPLTEQFAAEGRPHCGLLLVPPSLSNDQHWRIGHAIVAYDRAQPTRTGYRRTPWTDSAYRGPTTSLTPTLTPTWTVDANTSRYSVDTSDRCQIRKNTI
jgi:predicted nuclease of predicted toxin-antitoxin system